MDVGWNGNGELTLRLFRFCITLKAREEGIALLKLVCSNFYEESWHGIEKFEGIQTEEVAQTIAEFVCADFVRQVSGNKPLFLHYGIMGLWDLFIWDKFYCTFILFLDWDDVAELIKRIISSSRIIAK